MNSLFNKKKSRTLDHILSPGVFRSVTAVVCLLAMTACQRETATRSEKASSAEIRGEPINAPVVAKAIVDTNDSSRSQNEPTPSLAPAGYRKIGFEKLASFGFDLSDDLLLPATNQVEISAAISKRIPVTVKALDKQQVALTGFMLPLKVEAGSVTEFLIMRDQSMCCYGTTPKINEWVSVKTIKDGVKPLMDQPVTVLGTLYVGEMRENGYLTGIYRMDGEKLVEE